MSRKTKSVLLEEIVLLKKVLQQFHDSIAPYVICNAIECPQTNVVKNVPNTKKTQIERNEAKTRVRKVALDRKTPNEINASMECPPPPLKKRATVKRDITAVNDENSPKRLRSNTKIDDTGVVYRTKQTNLPIRTPILPLGINPKSNGISKAKIAAEKRTRKMVKTINTPKKKTPIETARINRSPTVEHSPLKRVAKRERSAANNTELFFESLRDKRAKNVSIRIVEESPPRINPNLNPMNLQTVARRVTQSTVTQTQSNRQAEQHRRSSILSELTPRQHLLDRPDSIQTERHYAGKAIALFINNKSMVQKITTENVSKRTRMSFSATNQKSQMQMKH